MRLDRSLSIGGVDYNVVTDRVVLALNQAGRASFSIDASKGEIAQYAPVAFDIGYAQHDNSQRLFFGYVESVTVIDDKRVTVFCREMANLLALPTPISLRHPTLTDVLRSVTETVELEFYTHDSGGKIPHFYNTGTGYRAIASLAALFKMPDFIWQQQGNGVVYIGTWQQSRWADRPIEIDKIYFEQHLSSQSVVMAAIPAMRPGVLMNGKRIKKLDFSGNKMTLEW